MSEDKIENQDDGKGVCRRSRKDDQGRDYVCGCGKKYLSYPALYTHIKTKHEGHQPEGTQKTGTINKRQKQKIDEKLLKQIYAWVQEEDLQVLAQLDENARGSVPVSQRVRRDYIGKELSETYMNLLKNNAFSLNKNSSLDLVFIIYLLGIGRYVSESMYSYYTTFAKHFRNCFYDYVGQIYESCFKGQIKTELAISRQQCKLAPIICDFFIRFYVAVEIKQTGEDFKCLMQLMTYDFCKWMYSKNLSIIKVSLQNQYKMTRKNFIQAKKKEKKEGNGRHKKQQDDHEKEGENEGQNDGEGDENMDDNEGHDHDQQNASDEQDLKDPAHEGMEEQEKNENEMAEEKPIQNEHHKDKALNQKKPQPEQPQEGEKQEQENLVVEKVVQDSQMMKFVNEQMDREAKKNKIKGQSMEIQEPVEKYQLRNQNQIEEKIQRPIQSQKENANQQQKEKDEKNQMQVEEQQK